MNDYYSTFKTKISFIIQMVNIYRIYIVPVSFFEFSKEINDGQNKITKQGIHKYGTQFKIFSLLDEFKEEFQKVLNSCDISFEIKKNKTIVFKLKKSFNI
jgi:hypothetical protein